MPVMVHNTQAGPTVFTDKAQQIAIEWAGSGDPSGGDYQQVPETIVTEHPAFIKAIRRGIFEVESAPEDVRRALDAQSESFALRERKAQEEATAVLDRPQDDDLVALDCVGPSQRGTGRCGQQVVVRANKQYDSPPLCSVHGDLASQYVPSEGEFDNSTGRAQREWTRMALGPRERLQQ